jgi:hypothetical protein
MLDQSVEVRSGLEVRMYLAGGAAFTNRKFFKRGETWGMTYSFDGHRERFKNRKEAQDKLNELIRKGCHVFNVKGIRIWPVLK